MDIGDCFLDPHYQEREVFIPIEHPVGGDEFIANLSWKMSETHGGVYRPAPLWGQHNSYVFEEILGLSREEVDCLEGQEVIQNFREPAPKAKEIFVREIPRRKRSRRNSSMIENSQLQNQSGLRFSPVIMNRFLMVRES